MAAFSAKNKAGKTYILHALERKTKKGIVKLFYFATKEKKGSIPSLPSGYKVTESPRTGLLLLKKTTK